VIGAYTDLEFMVKAFFTGCAAAIMVFAVASGARAQTATPPDRPCRDDTFLRKLAFKGFRLEMKRVELLKVVPEMKWTYRKEENTTIGEWHEAIPFPVPGEKPPPPLPSGISSIRARLFGDDVLGFWLTFKPIAKLQTLREITDSLSDEFKIPKEYWQVLEGGEFADVSCGVDLLEVSTSGDGDVGLSLETFNYAARVREFKARSKKSKSATRH